MSIPIDALAANSTAYSVVANPEQQAAIASWLGVPAVNALTGRFDVAAEAGGVRLTGRLVAELQRTCVVSLEPMIEAIDETFVIRFLRDFDEELAAADESDDYVEALEGKSLDLGAVLVEQLSLSMSAYPKRPEAVVAEPHALSRESPFAILRRVAKPGDEDV